MKKNKLVKRLNLSGLAGGILATAVIAMQAMVNSPMVAFAEEDVAEYDAESETGLDAESDAEYDAESDVCEYIPAEDEVTGYGVPIFTEEYTVEVVGASAVPTEKQAFDAMIALKESYPEGMHWTNDNFYGWRGGIFSGGFGCAGFAFLLSDEAFGNLPARWVENITIDDVHVGDILRINGNTHSVIILEKYDNYVILAEGNYNSSIHWGRRYTAEQIAMADYMLTRYPEGTFGTQYTISFDVNGGDSGSIANQLVFANKSTQLKNEAPTRFNYTFVGWSTSKYSNQVTYRPGESYVFTGDMTLYAVWTEGFDDSMYPIRLEQLGLEVYENGKVGLIMDFKVDPGYSDYIYSVIINDENNPENIDKCTRTIVNGMHRFTFALDAKEMFMNVYIVMYTSGYPRRCIGENYQSVLTYINAAMKLPTTSEEDKNLMRTLLNYGAAAQEYFDFSTDRLANSILTEEEKQIAVNPSDFCGEASIDGYLPGMKYLGSSLILDSGFSIKHYFMLANGEKADVYHAAENGNVRGFEDCGNGIVALKMSQSGIEGYTESSVLSITKENSSMILDYSIRDYVTYAYLNYNEGDSLYKLATAIVDFGNAYYNAVK